MDFIPRHLQIGVLCRVHTGKRSLCPGPSCQARGKHTPDPDQVCLTPGRGGSRGRIHSISVIHQSPSETVRKARHKRNHAPVKPGRSHVSNGRLPPCPSTVPRHGCACAGRPPPRRLSCAVLAGTTLGHPDTGHGPGPHPCPTRGTGGLAGAAILFAPGLLATPREGCVHRPVGAHCRGRRRRAPRWAAKTRPVTRDAPRDGIRARKAGLARSKAAHHQVSRTPEHGPVEACRTTP